MKNGANPPSTLSPAPKKGGMGWAVSEAHPLELVLRLGRFETTGDGAGIAHLALPVVQLISTLQFKKLQRLNDDFFLDIPKFFS